MSPLSAGWAKVQEIRRHLAFFRESGKYTMGYMAQVRMEPRVKLTQHLIHTIRRVSLSSWSRCLLLMTF